MKIEERIEKMKKVYRETPVSDEHIAKEWQLLEGMLGEQHQSRVSPHFFRTFAFLAVVLLLSGGVVTVAQASKPGELLYPVKEFSQKVVEEVKQSVPVFNSVIPTPTPLSQEVNDEDQLKQNGQADTVKGAKDEKEGNDYEEKNENSSWNNAGGRSEEKEEQKSENGNNRDNHSGSDNSNNNSQSENGKKENFPNSEKVDRSNSEHQGNANGKTSKK